MEKFLSYCTCETIINEKVFDIDFLMKIVDTHDEIDYVTRNPTYYIPVYSRYNENLKAFTELLCYIS